jgi:hypothetical protein
MTLLASVAALVAGGGASAATHANLVLAARQPIALKGRYFHAHEVVRVTLKAGTTRVKTVRAGSGGAFTVTFTDMNLPHCGGVFARARGNAGSAATLKIPLPACQPA